MAKCHEIISFFMEKRNGPLRKEKKSRFGLVCELYVRDEKRTTFRVVLFRGPRGS